MRFIIRYIRIVSIPKWYSIVFHYILSFSLLNTFSLAQAQEPIEQWVVGHNSLLSLYDDHEELSCENIPVLGHVSRGTTGFSNAYTATGQLLFYTDGIYIYNGEHQRLFNNLQLKSASFSSQSSSVIKHSSNTYSILTLSDRYQSNACIMRTTIESYTNEDSSSFKLGPLVEEELFCGNFGFLTAYNLECQGQFLLSYNFDSTDIYVFKITESTFELHQILETGQHVPTTQSFESFGGIYLSSKASLGVLLNTLSNNIYVFKINECDGTLSIIDTVIVKEQNSRLYSACFSSSGRFLYTIETQNGFNLFQYDMNSNDIEETKILIDTLGRSDLKPELQIGANNRIYLHNHLGLILSNVETFSLSVIQSPELKGLLCNFNKNAYPLCSYLDAFSPIPNRTYTIKRVPPPSIQVTDTTICKGELVWLESDTCIDSLYWTSSFQQEFIPDSSGYYSYRIKIDECSYIDSFFINVHPHYKKDTLKIRIKEGDNFDYQGQVLSVEGIYEFNLSTIHGCDSTIQVWLTIIQEQDNSSIFFDIPNIFTPNNDNINDIFSIQTPHNSKEQLDGLWIQDRWGNDMYSSLTNFSWHGKNSKNQALENGVYIYTIRLISSNGSTRLIKGNVTLLK